MLILNHKETPSFFEKLTEAGYFDQFKGKYLGNEYDIDSDIEAVTGATVSSRAFLGGY